MKTLDEVIKAVAEDLDQAAVSYPETFYDYDTHKDVLHYLEEYRSDRIQWEADRKNWQDQYAQAVENFKSATAKHLEALKEIKGINDPLTWDKLRTMEGKPVWFEVTDPKALPALDSGWGIVGCTSFSTWEGVGSFSLVKVGVTYAVPIALYGRAWNVYRKERL